MLNALRQLLSAPRRHREEDKLWKEKQQKTKEVGQMMMSLYDHYKSMAPKAIIDEMFQMHAHSEFPIWWFVGYYESVSYPIFFYIARHPELTASDSERLAQMLLWLEVKRFTADNSCRHAMLGACERFPTEEVLRLLREHLPFAQEQLEGERKGYFRDQWYGTEYVLTVPAGGVGTHRYADLSSEVARLQKLFGS